jgi:AcrR family transcriptional regulator
MEARLNLRLEQGAATRSALVAAARQLFAEKGYYKAGANDLVAVAGVTRGALYHHYRDKEALFEAVFRQVAGELYDKASLSVASFEMDRWRRLQEGLQAHLRLIAESREMQRILLLDGPAVLGWPRWRELQSEFSLGALVSAIEAVMANATINVTSPLMAAHLVLAALNEAALLIAHADSPALALAEVGEVLRALVVGLR